MIKLELIFEIKKKIIVQENSLNVIGTCCFFTRTTVYQIEI